MKKTLSNSTALIDQLKAIERLIEANALEQAAKQLNQLAAANAADPRVFLLASRLAEAARNPGGVLQAARTAYGLAPHWPVTGIHLAEVFAAQGHKVDAIALAKQAVSQATALESLDAELLNKAIGVAQRVGELESALQWLDIAQEMNPANPSTLYKIGLVQSALGQYAQSVITLTKALEIDSENRSIRIARLRSAIAVGNLAIALTDSNTLLALEPGNAELVFYHEVAQGKTPSTQPSVMVSQLFDSIADNYDQRWVVELHYKLPRDIALRIHEWYPDRKEDILDLGCGTGLLGACLGPIEGVLVGVDVSEKMMALAARHGVYDKFHHVNLVDALKATPDNLYNLITALDVLIYVGELDDIVSNAHRILVPGGRLVFACETQTEGSQDFSLTAGFADVGIEETAIRSESGLAVPGFLAIAQKSNDVAVKKTGQRSTKNAKPANP